MLFSRDIGLEPRSPYFMLLLRNVVPAGEVELFRSYEAAGPLQAWRLTPAAAQPAASTGQRRWPWGIAGGMGPALLGPALLGQQQQQQQRSPGLMFDPAGVYPLPSLVPRVPSRAEAGARLGPSHSAGGSNSSSGAQQALQMLRSPWEWAADLDTPADAPDAAAVAAAAAEAVAAALTAAAAGGGSLDPAASSQPQRGEAALLERALEFLVGRLQRSLAPEYAIAHRWGWQWQWGGAGGGGGGCSQTARELLHDETAPMVLGNELASLAAVDESAAAPAGIRSDPALAALPMPSLQHWQRVVLRGGGH